MLNIRNSRGGKKGLELNSVLLGTLSQENDMVRGLGSKIAHLANSEIGRVSQVVYLNFLPSPKKRGNGRRDGKWALFSVGTYVLYILLLTRI